MSLFFLRAGPNLPSTFLSVSLSFHTLIFAPSNCLFITPSLLPDYGPDHFYIFSPPLPSLPIAFWIPPSVRLDLGSKYPMLVAESPFIVFPLYLGNNASTLFPWSCFLDHKMVGDCASLPVSFAKTEDSFLSSGSPFLLP